MSRIVKSSYLGMDPFDDFNSAGDTVGLEPEQSWLFYRKCNLMTLPKSTGLYELGLVLVIVINTPWRL